MRKPQTERPSWDEYFLTIAETIGLRATCDRGRAGCVVTKDHRIVATGYVGAPPGLPHCDDAGHQYIERINPDGTKSTHCVRTAHAEENTVVHAARFGASLLGATMYCKMMPCGVCARMIITAGIERVVAKNDYHGAALSKEMFDAAGIKYEIVSSHTETYEKM